MRVQRPLARLATAAALCLALAGCESIGETTKITGLPEWEPAGGPPGGSVLDVTETASGVLLALSVDRGLVRSTDGGASWERVPALPPGSYARQFASPNPDTILTLVNDGTILRSTDGGATWPVVASGIMGYELLAGFGRAYCRTAEGILRSTDAGESWTIAAVFDAPRLHAVTPEGHVYVSASPRRLYRSTDGGDSWSRIDGDAIPDLITTAAVLPGVGILVGTSMRSVFLSTDDGASWRAVGEDAFGDATLVWRITTVGGEAWVNTDDEGIFATGDGETWRRMNLPAFSIWCVCPVSGSAVIVGTDRAGAWTTADGGDSWSPLPVTGEIAEPVDILPVPGGGMLVATNDAGIWYSPDGTGSWRPANGAIREPSALFLRNGPGGDLWAMTVDGLYRSGDPGGSWECRGDRFTLALTRAFDVAPDGRPWVACCSPSAEDQGIFVSPDDGASWARSYLPERKYACIQRLVAAPDGRIIASADDIGVIVLEESGSSWTGAGLAGESLRALAAAGGGGLLAGGYRDAWLQSGPDRSWRSLGLDAGATRLFRRSGGILALTHATNRLVFMPIGSDDWFPFDDGMAGVDVRDVEIDAEGRGWAAADDGVWRTAEPCSWLR